MVCSDLRNVPKKKEVERNEEWMANAARALTTPNLSAVSGGERRTSLVNPATDFIMIGGASVLLYMLVSVMLAPQNPDAAITWVVFYLSFAVNFPHFLVSYQLLYHDAGHLIFKRLRFFWAAVLAPAILIALLAGAVMIRNQSILGYFANAMYFFVGWHYVKQIFGGVVVTNALQKFYYSRTERWALQANLYCMWFISWIAQNIGLKNFTYEGIPYHSLNMPAHALTVCYWAVGLTFAGVAYTHIRKWVREGRWPTPAAFICFASIYVWFLPALYHPMFFLIIPFFHSLQYLLFVYAFRRNKVETLVGPANSPANRKAYLKRLYGYLLLSAGTGAVAFWFLPKFVDSLHFDNPAIYGPTLAMFAITIFINIHHYFIDNVIWKGNNPEVKQYLFQH